MNFIVKVESIILTLQALQAPLNLVLLLLGPVHHPKRKEVEEEIKTSKRKLSIIHCHKVTIEMSILISREMLEESMKVLNYIGMDFNGLQDHNQFMILTKMPQKEQQ